MKKVKFKDILSYLIIIAVVLLIRAFIMTPVKVVGDSMVPTLINGDVLILNKLDRNYNRFDIVVVKLEEENEEIIKRVIGLPGETIECENNQLYINTKKLDDPYNDGFVEDFLLIKLEENEYFIMGDNRKVSKDSRSFGKINKKDLKGSANLRLFPFNKIEIVK